MANTPINLDVLIQLLLEVTAYKRVSFPSLMKNFGLSEEQLIQYATWLAKLGLPLGEVSHLDSKYIEIMPSAYKEKEYFSLSDFIFLLKQLPTSQVKNQKELKKRIIIWRLTKEEFDQANEVLHAIDTEQKLSCYYENKKGEFFERLLIPLRILWSRGNWFLEAYCLFRNEKRFFRIDRMKEIHSVSLNVVPDFKTADTSNMSIEAHLLFDLGMRKYIGEEFASEALEETEKGVKVTVLFQTMNEAVDKILDYENHVSVLSPKELRERVAKEYENDFPPFM